MSLLEIIGLLAVVKIARDIWRYFRMDRSGNSGRARHWAEE